jgi:tRNA(Ile)-lysidine synthase
MTEIPKSAITAIDRYQMLPRGSRVVVGLSGGADSVCLLHVLLRLRKEYSLDIRAVHVNHGIRGAEADADESFVSQICRELGVELDIYRYNAPEEAARMRRGLEEAGRELRYLSYEKSLQNKIGRIAVGHNSNDNAETVLMRVFRGTGMKGLAGIPPVRGNIIRPLITTPRAEIESFCRENDILYRTDSTNLKNIYTRNAVRLELLPLAEEKISQGAVENISRLTQIISQEDSYLDRLAGDALARCVLDEGKLSIPVLEEYPEALRRRILRLFLLPYSKELRDISYEHISMALGMLDKKTGSELNLPSGITLARCYDSLTIPRDIPEFCYDIPLDTEVFIPEARP